MKPGVSGTLSGTTRNLWSAWPGSQPVTRDVRTIGSPRPDAHGPVGLMTTHSPAHLGYHMCQRNLGRPQHYGRAVTYLRCPPPPPVSPSPSSLRHLTLPGPCFVGHDNASHQSLLGMPFPRPPIHLISKGHCKRESLILWRGPEHKP